MVLDTAVRPDHNRLQLDLEAVTRLRFLLVVRSFADCPARDTFGGEGRAFIDAA